MCKTIKSDKFSLKYFSNKKNPTISKGGGQVFLNIFSQEKHAQLTHTKRKHYIKVDLD